MATWRNSRTWRGCRRFWREGRAWKLYRSVWAWKYLIWLHVYLKSPFVACSLFLLAPGINCHFLWLILDWFEGRVCMQTCCVWEATAGILGPAQGAPGRTQALKGSPAFLRDKCCSSLVVQGPRRGPARPRSPYACMVRLLITSLLPLESLWNRMVRFLCRRITSVNKLFSFVSLLSLL